jgi:hypothetical protein
MLVFNDFRSPFPEGNYVGTLISTGSRIFTRVIVVVHSARSFCIRSEDGYAGGVIAL